MIKRIIHTKGNNLEGRPFPVLAKADAGIGDEKPAVANTDYLPGSTVVGWGYDIWGRYADTESTVKQLIDWEKVPTKNYKGFLIPEIIDVIENEKSYYKTIAGETITTMQDSLNSSTNVKGKYNMFSGSLSASFDEQATQSATNSFTYMIQALKLYSISLDIAKAKAYLKDDVKYDINNLSPSELFDTYGTHFLAHIVMGARATMSNSVNKSTFKSSLSLSVATEISYQALTWQLSGDNTTKYSNDIESFKTSSQTEIVTVGGDATKGGANIQESGGFKAWADTVKQNPVMIDFADNNALVPIWFFCDTPERVKALEVDNYPAYAEHQSNENEIYVNAITDVCVISGDKSEIQVPTGFVKCPGDLNEGVGGKFIYIGYKLSTRTEIEQQNLSVVTGLTVIKNNDAVPDGYTKINQDLNEKAGGDDVFVCYKKEPLNKPQDTLKSIIVVAATYPQIYPPVPYERIGQDCNSGSGGKFIYICYSKTL